MNFDELSSPRLIYYATTSSSISRLKEIEVSAPNKIIFSSKGEDAFKESQHEIKWKAGDEGINIQDVIIPFSEYMKIDMLFQKKIIDSLILNNKIGVALSDIAGDSAFEYTIPGEFIQKKVVESWESAVWLADKYSSQVKNKCAMGIVREAKVTNVHVDAENVGELKIIIDATTKKIIRVKYPTPKSLRVDFEGVLCDQPDVKVIGHYITEYKQGGFDSVNSTFQDEKRWQNKSNFAKVLGFAFISIFH